MGCSNELQHIFNTARIDWVESIQANEDSVAYLKTPIE